MHNKIKLILSIVIVITLTGCSSKYSISEGNKSLSKKVGYTNKYNQSRDGLPNLDEIPDLANIKEPQPKYEPKSRYGNPPNYRVFNKTYKVLKSSDGFKERGYASWYGTKFHGFRTSSGETYNMYAMTAAHKTLPLPTYLKITNLSNKKSVIVKCNDRGPFHGDRIIDLSYAAAKKLDIVNNGVGLVEVVAINPKIYNKPEPSSQTLQLGAFAEEVNAKKFAEQLTTILKQHQADYDKHYKINILSEKKNNLKNSNKKNILYKVIVSSLGSELNIDNLKKILSSKITQ